MDDPDLLEDVPPRFARSRVELEKYLRTHSDYPKCLLARFSLSRSLFFFFFFFFFFLFFLFFFSPSFSFSLSLSPLLSLFSFSLIPHLFPLAFLNLLFAFLLTHSFLLHGSRFLAHFPPRRLSLRSTPLLSFCDCSARVHESTGSLPLTASALVRPHTVADTPTPRRSPRRSSSSRRTTRRAASGRVSSWTAATRRSEWRARPPK